MEEKCSSRMEEKNFKQGGKIIQQDGEKCQQKRKGTKRLLYTFYEKEMASKYTIMKNSVLPENCKIQCLANDLVRRLKNTSERLPQHQRNTVVNIYTEKLLRSGYKKDQVTKVIEAGLKGYEKIVRLEREGKTKIHRSAASTVSSRYMKKLTGKTTWFLEKNEKQGNESEKQQNHPASSKKQLPLPPASNSRKYEKYES